jgi:RimJ/RimL family protein N-acetyltransferase
VTEAAPGVDLAARTDAHARVLLPLIHGTAVCDTLVWDGPDTAEEFLSNYASPLGDPAHRHFTIVAGPAAEPVGALSVRPGFQPGRGDLGYWVGIPHQGRGIATLAVARALDLAFGEMGMEKVEACAFLGNLASRRVLEKNGFALEGLVRKAVLKRGRWLDEWLFGVIREEWAARRSGPPA